MSTGRDSWHADKTAVINGTEYLCGQKLILSDVDEFNTIHKRPTAPHMVDFHATFKRLAESERRSSVQIYMLLNIIKDPQSF